MSPFLRRRNAEKRLAAASIQGTVLSLAAVFVLAFGALGCAGSQPSSEKLDKLPITSIHSTSGQKGLQHVTLGADFVDQEILERFNKLLPRASNLFVCQATDVSEAMRAGLRFDGRSTIPLPKQGDKSQLWLIVFLGFKASSPPQWIIDSVEYNQAKLRVTFSVESELLQRTRDSHPYFYLIPLKGIKRGSYDVELRESNTKEVVLMRKVRIQAMER